MQQNSTGKENQPIVSNCHIIVQTQQVNVEIVKNCVTQVMLTARQVRNEHDQEARSSYAVSNSVHIFSNVNIILVEFLSC